MLIRVVSLLIGYTFGCLLTADLVSRKLEGKSAFDLGVGNPGMANIGHELGTRAAAFVLAGDIGKTLAAWLIVRALFPFEAGIAGVYAGLGATLGHNYPAWHRFSGGKGVTTTCSAIILASPVWGLISCVFGFAMVIIGRYLCLGALGISTCYLILTAIFGHSTERTVVAAVLLLLMAIAHGSAIIGIRTDVTPNAGIADSVRCRLFRRQ